MTNELIKLLVNIYQNNLGKNEDAFEIICYSICPNPNQTTSNNLLAAIVLLFVELSLPLIPCCHGPGKGWIMDHALVTLIVINLSGVMTHVSDTVKLWSALSPLYLFPLLFHFNTVCIAIFPVTSMWAWCYNVEVCVVITLQHVYITRNPGETCV